MTGTVVTMISKKMLADRYRTAFERSQRIESEWIDTVLEMATTLREARDQFKDHNEFSAWIDKNDLRFHNDKDRAALINMGRNLEVSRTVLQKTKRKSLQFIWIEDIKPMTEIESLANGVGEWAARNTTDSDRDPPSAYVSQSPPPERKVSSIKEITEKKKKKKKTKNPSSKPNKGPKEYVRKELLKPTPEFHFDGDRKYGRVHIMPVAHRALTTRQGELVEFCASVRKLCVAAEECNKTAFEVVEFFDIAATMTSGARSSIRDLAQRLDALLSLAQTLQPYVQVLKQRAKEYEKQVKK
jgi:hypothetical protein